jgi:hypothetical protein
VKEYAAEDGKAPPFLSFKIDMEHMQVYTERKKFAFWGKLW